LSRYAFPIFYVLGLAVVMMMLYALNYLFWTDFDWNWRNIASPLQLLSIRLNNLADGLIIMLPLLLLPARRRGWQWLVLILLAVWCVVQALYHPNYLDIMPWSSFTMVQNVKPVTMKSAAGSFRLGQLHLVFWLALLAIIYVVALRKGVKRYHLRHRWRWVWLSVLAFVIIRLFNPVCVNYNTEKQGYKAQMLECYTIPKGHTDLYFKHTGFVSYTLYSMISSLSDLRGLSDEERQQMDDYLARNPQYTDCSHASGRQNLIFILVESLNSWVVDLTIDGRPVTPTLNRLCADSSNLVAPHMKTQVKNGHSSDGQFMYITGLLPLTTSAVSMSYPNAAYPSFFKAMPQHKKLLIAPDNPAMWNLEKMCKSYGIEQLYAKKNLTPYFEANDYHADRAVMKFALDTLTAQTTPFVAVVKTIDMHSPFDKLRIDATWISQSQQYTAAVRNYLELTAYFDHQLDEFLDDLSRSPIADNTMVVIVGDHCERVDNDPQGRAAINADGDDCMFLVVNPGEGNGMHKQEPFGQIDVYPTLLDLMGANTYGWKGMGNSLLRNNVRSVAVTPTEVKGDRDDALVPRQLESWDIAGIMIKRHYLPADR